MATTPEREKSYINWRGKVLPVDLARAGFVYTGEDDKVFCTSCNIKLASWEANDKPFEEHKSNSGTCPFVCGVLKVCQESNRECDDVLCCDEVECCAQSSRCTQADAIPRNIPFGDDLVGVQSMDDMDLNHEGQRRATFKGWPLENPSVDKLLDAGFCYTGQLQLQYGIVYLTFKILQI